MATFGADYYELPEAIRTSDVDCEKYYKTVYDDDGVKTAHTRCKYKDGKCKSGTPVPCSQTMFYIPWLPRSPPSPPAPPRRPQSALPAPAVASASPPSPPPSPPAVPFVCPSVSRIRGRTAGVGNTVAC